MSADDGFEGSVIAKQRQGVVDAFREVAPPFCHAEGIVLPAVGLWKDGEPLVLTDEGARRLLVLHDAAQLALEQRLNGVGGLREPFNLCAGLVMLHSRHLRVGRGTELHADLAPWQVVHLMNGFRLVATACENKQKAEPKREGFPVGYVHFVVT